jgi:hypothetical protein
MAVSGVLFEGKVGNGRVTITSESVTLRRTGGLSTESIRRNQITNVSSATIMLALFGIGGLKRIVISTTDGRRLLLPAVRPKDAKQILAILN